MTSGNALSKRAKEIIEKINYATIASVTDDGKPWNSPVFTQHDDDFNFYWGTYKDSQKAKNIRNNPNVFIVIYDSTVPAGEGEGVYIKAVTRRITDVNEMKSVIDLISNRRKVPYWTLKDFEKDGPIYLFKSTPENIWMNGEGEIDGHYIDTRTEIDINQLKN